MDPDEKKEEQIVAVFHQLLSPEQIASLAHRLLRHTGLQALDDFALEALADAVSGAVGDCIDQDARYWPGR